MSIWTLGEGGYIKVTFDQSLIGTVADNEQHFTVSWQENEYAPNGPVTVSKSFNPESTGFGESDTNLILTMASTQQFNNAAVEIAHGQPGSEVIIDDSANGMPLTNLTISITPVQAGSGDPSPDNVRPISGWTGATIFRSGANPSNPEEIAVSWADGAGTVYGGTLDVLSGVLTVDRVMLDLGEQDWQTTNPQLGIFWLYARRSPFYVNGRYVIQRPSSMDTPADFLCSKYKTVAANDTEDGSVYWHTSSSYIGIIDTNYTNWTTGQVKADLAGVQLLCRLVSPLTYQLTPQQIAILSGTNHIWANTGDILSLDYWRQTPIRVQYDGLGTLRGLGGPVEAFDETFVPVGLIQKPSQKVAEHIEISNITFNGQLMAVDYTEGKAAEHIEISNITFNGALIDVGDL